MRLGFLLGFVLGGAIASLLGRGEEGREGAADGAEGGAAHVNPVAERVKHQVGDARDAAREAQLEKESEMLRMYDEMIHRKAEPKP